MMLLETTGMGWTDPLLPGENDYGGQLLTGFIYLEWSHLFNKATL
jgi:hypothetical protein